MSGLTAALALAAVLSALTATKAGHEVSYYPSFYPQEIRIEPLDPDTAAKEFVKTSDPLNVYLGAAPRFAEATPAHLKSLVSLRSFVVATTNPQSQRLASRDARCGAVDAAAAALAQRADIVAHRLPVTPYHADYLAHTDRPAGVSRETPAKGPQPVFRPGDTALLTPGVQTQADNWEIRLDEVPIRDILLKAGAGIGAWLPPPWIKEGWFQAYHLLRPALADAGAGARERADVAYEHLTGGEFRDLAERIGLERELVAALTETCERAVIGYRLRREFYHDAFSDGIENIVADSQTGFNSPVFLRTVKLKDFPWNGWMRVGIAERPQAAWNPVAGFTDTPGRLVWSIVGDDAYLAVPYNSRWVQNRAEILPDDDDSAQRRQSVRIPADALMPQAGTGALAPVGGGKGAMAKLIYRLSASSFHDGTEMDAADLFFPYALAFRWGAGDATGATFDPDIAAATKLMRERLRGVRQIRVEQRTLELADLKFEYRSPVVELYLDDLAEGEDVRALIAPPWNSVPWHVLALMEAAVERGIAAFSQREAARRNVPWLDLVRDAAQREKFAALIKEFAASGYRPTALASLVSAETATARWQALGKFLAEQNHLLVTNGPYRLASATPEAIVLNVVREFTYPIGIGQFDPFAYPPRALITSAARAGDEVLVSADVELAIKQQRDRRIVRVPVKRDTLRDTIPLRPVTRYLIIGENGKVAAAGAMRWRPDGRFAAPLPASLPPGAYSFLATVAIDGNAVDPAIARVDLRIGGAGQ